MKYFYVILIFITFVFCCNNYEEILLEEIDITPPSLLSIKATELDTLIIEGNENIKLKDLSYVSRENIKIRDIQYKDNNIIIKFETTLIPGMQYKSEFRIEDTNGNSLSFITNFYGYNPNIPQIIINEFIVKGSKTNPNKIELYVKSEGNLAGLSLFNGTKNNYDYVYIFPSINVIKGDYIVIRTLSNNYPEPFIELLDLNVNHDKKFKDGVRDLRIDNFKLSTTNGVITIYDNPYGEIIDAVIYSKNHNDDTKNHRNFGLSKTMDRVDEITSENAWIGDYDIIFPDDVIFSGESTSTRSLNRKNLIDNNSKEEWITVQTRESTFGSINSLKEY